MEDYIFWAAEILEVMGVAIIVIGVLFSFIKYVIKYSEQDYDKLRRNIGRAILLGLEVLVGADIIATIVKDLDLRKVLTLGIIIVVRTLLSFSLEIELEGRLPWHKST